MGSSEPQRQGGLPIKLNLGCGNRKIPGYVNVDKVAACNPDQIVNLERTPWPWPDNSVSEIQLIHTLEHLGRKPDDFIAIMREMYRVCRPDAKIGILVPHHRHDNFASDPTHVRAITPMGLALFDKQQCEKWQEGGFSNTPLALYHNVDFVIENVHHDVEQAWLDRIKREEISQEELDFYAQHFCNVITQTHFVLRVRKEVDGSQ